MSGKPKRVDFKINSIRLISWHFYVYQMHPLSNLYLFCPLCEIAFGANDGLSYDDEQKLDENVHQRNSEIKGGQMSS